MADCATHLSLVSPLKYRRRWRRIAGLFGWILGTGLAATAPWPHELGDVPPDPAVRWGRLENGLRYAVRKNTEPAGRVSLVLQVAAGSVDERDDQRGYAHFVEHMMFRGTKHHRPTRWWDCCSTRAWRWARTPAPSPTTSRPSTTSTSGELGREDHARPVHPAGFRRRRHLHQGGPQARGQGHRKRAPHPRLHLLQLGEALVDFLHPGTLITHRQPIGTPESLAAATPSAWRLSTTPGIVLPA